MSKRPAIENELVRNILHQKAVNAILPYFCVTVAYSYGI
jgi:hypothetical protein